MNVEIDLVDSPSDKAEPMDNLKEFDGLTAALALVREPIASARGLPNAVYVDEAVHDIENARVLAGGWSCAGFGVDAPGPGDVCPIMFAGQPLLLVRDGNGRLHVFHNVCRHRGRTLAVAAASARKSLVCPYHSWTYGLDGKLLGTPHIGGPGTHNCPGFAKDEIGLLEVRSAEWMGLVFVDLSGTAEPFDTFIGAIDERWRPFMDRPLVHTGADSSISFTLACNWKLAVENYCESYHLPWVHPGLNSYSPLSQHEPIIADGFSGQISLSYDPAFPEGAPALPVLPDLPDFWQLGAEYIALYPNVLLGIHRDHYFAVLIEADGPAATRERFEIFYFDDRVRGADFQPTRTANRDLWQTIFAEDRDAVECMQAGRRSPAFDGGIFSPVMDEPTHTYHKWIAAALLHGRSAAPTLPAS